MNIRSFFSTLFFLLLLVGCASRSNDYIISKQSLVVMLVKVNQERKVHKIVIALDKQSAPQTVANFQTLCHRHFYDGLRFHRVFPHQLIQTGDPKSRVSFIINTLQKIGLDFGDACHIGTGGANYTIPSEIHLNLDQGSVVAARLPDSINPTRASNGSQFFVCIHALPKLNGQYTVFGHIIQGIEALNTISCISANSNDFPNESAIIQSMRNVQ